MGRIFVIDGDRMFGECIRAALGDRFGEALVFTDAIAVTNELDESLPDLIFTEVNLPGVNVFTLLNELVSYPDTAAIPIVIVSDVEFPSGGWESLKEYGIKAILRKDKLKPEEIQTYAERYTRKRICAKAN